MIVGKDFTDMTFAINGSTFSYGLVIDAAIRFVSIAAVVFFLVVKPMEAVAARRASGDEVEDVPPSTEDLLAEIRDLLATKQ